MDPASTPLGLNEPLSSSEVEVRESPYIETRAPLSQRLKRCYEPPRMKWTLVVGLMLTAIACGGGGPTVASSSSPEDERHPVGRPSPGPDSPEGLYCASLGYTRTLDQCVFPDGTGCEYTDFYAGQCGQPHSYCEQHGGTLSTGTPNVGPPEGYAVCTVPGGAQCKEVDYAATGACP
jgi:putative hemolysin